MIEVREVDAEPQNLYPRKGFDTLSTIVATYRCTAGSNERFCVDLSRFNYMKQQDRNRLARIYSCVANIPLPSSCEQLLPPRFLSSGRLWRTSAQPSVG